MAFFEFYKKTMLSRNGLPRDFTLMRYFLKPWSDVFITKFGKNYPAKFVADKFISAEGEIFGSPYAFSKYVTNANDCINIPSGWSVIYTKLSNSTNPNDSNEIIPLDMLYDRSVYELIAKYNR